jgi:hypothetical protein
MIAFKLLAASILFLTATFAAEDRPCNGAWQEFGSGTSYQMHLIPGPQPNFELAGFTVKKVRDGLYRLQAGPTKRNMSVIRLATTGVSRDTYARYYFANYEVCTVEYPEGAPGTSMRAFVETFNPK